MKAIIVTHCSKCDKKIKVFNEKHFGFQNPDKNGEPMYSDEIEIRHCVTWCKECFAETFPHLVETREAVGVV